MGLYCLKGLLCLARGAADDAVAWFEREWRSSRAGISTPPDNAGWLVPIEPLLRVRDAGDAWLPDTMLLRRVSLGTSKPAARRSVKNAFV